MRHPAPPASAPTDPSVGAPPVPLRIAALLWVLAPTVYLLAEAVAATAFDGYSYATNYISDLGVPEVGVYEGRTIDSPLAAVMNAGFLGEGVLFALAAVVAFWALPAGLARAGFLGLAVLHWFGLSLVGLVPGSTESIEAGVAHLHVIGAGMAIVAGNLAVIVAGSRMTRWGLPRLRVPSVVLGSLGLLGLALLLLGQNLDDPLLLGLGTWERLAVYPFMLWQLVVGIALLRRTRG